MCGTLIDVSGIIKTTDNNHGESCAIIVRKTTKWKSIHIGKKILLLFENRNFDLWLSQ